MCKQTSEIPQAPAIWICGDHLTQGKSIHTVASGLAWKENLGHSSFSQNWILENERFKHLVRRTQAVRSWCRFKAREALKGKVWLLASRNDSWIESQEASQFQEQNGIRMLGKAELSWRKRSTCLWEEDRCCFSSCFCQACCITVHLPVFWWDFYLPYITLQ